MHLLIGDSYQPIDEFTASYIEAALWSSTDGDGEALDAEHGPDDISPETLAQMIADCAAFQEDNAADLEASGLEPGRAGHDFWLTREGHGAGFWDEGLGDIGDRLTNAAHAYGSFYLYVGDDELVHQ